MSLSKESLEALEARLATLSETATAEELAYITKALEIIAGKTTALDIVQLADDKIQEIQSLREAGLAQILETKAEAEQDLQRQKEEAETVLNEEKDAVLEILEADILQKLQILEARKNEDVTVIQEERNKIANDLREELATFDEINDIPEGSTIMEEIKKRSLIEAGSLPLLFGILSRSQEYCGSDNLTTELWTSGDDIGVNLLGAIAGCCLKTVKLSWVRPPQLFFFQGETGTFAYKALNAVYGASTNQYNYPHACIGAFFVKNTTDTAITTTFNAGRSSYSTYSGHYLFTVAANSNKTTVSSTALASTTSSSDGAYAARSLTIPANSTIAVVMQASSYYKTTNSSYYVLFEQWLMSGLCEFMVEGLEIDYDMTLRAWQCPGYATPLGLWADPVSESSEPDEATTGANSNENEGANNGTTESEKTDSGIGDGTTGSTSSSTTSGRR